MHQANRPWALTVGAGLRVHQRARVADLKPQLPSDPSKVAVESALLRLLQKRVRHMPERAAVRKLFAFCAVWRHASQLLRPRAGSTGMSYHRPTSNNPVPNR